MKNVFCCTILTNPLMLIIYPYKCYSKFDLDVIEEDECKSQFRFIKSDIFRLVDAFGFPETFTCYNGSVFDVTEAICIFLKHFAYPCRYSDMIYMFARPVPELSLITNHILSFMHNQWNHLLSSLQQPWLSQQNLENFCDFVHRRGAPLTNCWRFCGWNHQTY